MPARLLSDLTNGLVERMAVFLRNGISCFLVIVRFRAFLRPRVKPFETYLEARIAPEHTFRARYEIVPRVRTGTRHVVLEHDGASKRGADRCHIHVGHRKSLAASNVTLLESCGRKQFIALLHTVHRHQIVKSVATVDAHVHCDGAQSMRGVLVSGMQFVPMVAPALPRNIPP